LTEVSLSSQSQYEGRTWANFIDALRSPATKQAYPNSLKRYLRFHKLNSIDDLLTHASDPKYIEQQIIDYIRALKNDGIGYSTIQFLIAPIFTFYQINDVVLNRKKVSRYLGEFKKVVKDGAYTTEQIQTMLKNADMRMSMIIHIFSSTSCRIGALPDLTLGDLTKLPEYGLYKIVFYEGTNNEMYTFTTRECASAIDSYLLYRQRCNERISFNEKTQQWEPPNTPLIRLQFDVNDGLQVRNPQPVTRDAIRMSLELHLIKSGIRHVEHPTAPNSQKRVRKAVSLTKGYRKRAISIFIQAGLNHEIREMLVDHATMLDQNYFRPTEEAVLEEYLKAEPFLTIDPSLRLQKENEMLKIEKNSFDALAAEVEKLKAAINKD